MKIKITIDTKEDSHEEIKKIIRMLSSLVGEKEVFENRGNVFESDKSPPNLFGMFDNQAKKNEEEVKKDISEIKEEELPEVIEYS